MAATVPVGMVQEFTYPPIAPRTTKEARTLKAAGFDVHLLTPPLQGRPRIEKFPDLTVYRAQLPGSPIVSKLLNEFHRITFMHPSWQRAIRSFLVETGARLLHAHDLTYAATCLAANRRTGLPSILDLHENYPAAVHVWYRNLSPWRKHVTQSYSRLLRHERAMCRRYGHVLTVVDEMKERLVRVHGVEADRISVVLNAEEKGYDAVVPPLPAEFATRFAKGPLLSYVGGFGSHRGLEVAVAGTERLVRNVPEALLLLVGGPEAYEGQLVSQVAELGIEDNVIFGGWQPSELLAAFMRSSTVGLVPHNSNEHTDHTIPHKLFQYMTLGVPVLVSDCRPLARVVAATGAGLVFKAGDPDSFAEQAARLCGDEALRRQLGAKGREATIQGPWNWETAARDLPDTCRRLLGT